MVSSDISIMIICLILPCIFLAIWFVYTKVDEYFIFRRREELLIRLHEQAIGRGSGSGNHKVVLDGMKPEERTRVLEHVLNCKPYSKELKLGAQLKIVEQNKNDNDEVAVRFPKTLIIQEQKGHGNSKDSEKSNENGREWLFSSDKKNDHSNCTNDEDPEVIFTTMGSNGNQQNQDRKEEEVTSTLDRICKELGMKNQSNNNERKADDPDSIAATDEVAEICAICMEDYEEDQDVIIGHHCIHIYHKECVLTWMTAKHDSCPYCRTHMFDVTTFRQKAEEVLGATRYSELMEQDDPEIGEGGTSGSNSSSRTGDDD